jgi:hypothetical protein
MDWNEFAYGREVYSAYNRNENHKIFLGVKVRPKRKSDNLTAIYEPTV